MWCHFQHKDSSSTFVDYEEDNGSAVGSSAIVVLLYSLLMAKMTTVMYRQ